MTGNGDDDPKDEGNDESESRTFVVKGDSDVVCGMRNKTPGEEEEEDEEEDTEATRTAAAAAVDDDHHRDRMANTSSNCTEEKKQDETEDGTATTKPKQPPPNDVGNDGANAGVTKDDTKDGADANDDNVDAAADGDAVVVEQEQEQQEQKQEQQQEQQTNQVMALNVAYEALEQVRQANITIEFGKDVSPKQCIPCLRQQLKEEKERAAAGSRSRLASFRGSNRFFRRSSSALPCLTCGYQVCTQHRCPEFGRENIIICTSCAKFFSLDFVADASDQSQSERIELMNHMLDVYDRAYLILKYSLQFIDEIASALDTSTKQKDKLSFGSSATGFLGGLVGVAGAITIFTPAGPPLILASILFGSAGAATSASNEVMFHRSSANQAADTILTVHGILQSLARLSEQYCTNQAEKQIMSNATDAENSDANNQEVLDEEETTMADAITKTTVIQQLQKEQQQRNSSRCSSTIDSSTSGANSRKNWFCAITDSLNDEAANNTSTQQLETTASTNNEQQQEQRQRQQQQPQQQAPIPPPIPQRQALQSQQRSSSSSTDYSDANRKNWVRATANVIKPLTLGVASAASIVMEAREMKSTIDKIRNGSPCSKSNNLRQIATQRDVDFFPSTQILAEECRHYFVS